MSVISRIKHSLGKKLNKVHAYVNIKYFLKIYKTHKKNEIKNITNRKKPIYYIIRFDDEQHCGWTVWERVVLYQSIYAKDCGMIPVVDMQNYRSIYQEETDYKKVNAWDLYYEQPVDVPLDVAYDSNNYILSDSSQEWFVWVRMRKSKRFTHEYLRQTYNTYIRLKKPVIEKLEGRFRAILPTAEKADVRMLGICVRGTDYKKFHHAVQPEIKALAKEAAYRLEEYHCKYYFIATEDCELYEELKSFLPKKKILTYNAGNIKQCDGLIGDFIRNEKSADESSMDYLTTLYILDKCTGLIGGVCGATIVAQYRRKVPYEYIDIKDYGKFY